MFKISDHFMTLTDAADKIGINRQTVLRWTKSGKLNAQRIGRVTFIEKSEVEKIKKVRSESVGAGCFSETYHQDPKISN